MALIIRPNGGINNAMAGLAAGVTQGMQLGMEAEKIAVEKQRRQDEANYREGMQAIAKSAEARSQQMFDVQMGQMRADQLGGGLMAQVDQLGADLGARRQRSMDDYARIASNWRRLQENPQLGVDQQGNELPAAKWIKAQALLGPQLNDDDMALLDQYNQKLKTATEAAAYMSPEKQSQFRSWSEKLALRDLDTGARQSFAKNIADNLRRGAYRVMLEDGSEVDDKQISSRIAQLSQMSADVSIPTAQLRQMHDGILREVQATNERQVEFVSKSGQLRTMLEAAKASGQNDVVTATQKAIDSLKTGTRGPALAEMVNAARDGNVIVYDMNGQKHQLPASSAGQTLSTINDLIVRGQAATVKAAEYQPEYQKGMVEAAKTRAVNVGASASDPAMDQARRDWNALPVEEQQNIVDKAREEDPNYQVTDWIEERAKGYGSRPMGVGSGSANAKAPQIQKFDVFAEVTDEDKLTVKQQLASMGLLKNPQSLTPKEAWTQRAYAATMMLKLKGFTPMPNGTWMKGGQLYVPQLPPQPKEDSK